VEAASLHAQSLQEAPANVSIVSDREIRRYGYRTLNEVLSSVRGFYTSYDRIYHYVGINGFSLPGDYNTRFLVMLNGHPLTVPTSNSNGAFGQDFPIDLDLVARIEVIRGPTSALYGSNGILASINIVTKSPVDAEAFRVSPEFGSYGERKVLASASLNLGGGANLLISASVFHSTGAIQDVDGEQGYHTFANLVWHNWSFTGLFSNRVKQPPVPWGEEALFYERGDYVRDGHNLLLATRTSKWKGGQFRWESYFNQYKYDDHFDYPSAGRGIIDVRSTARGESAGTQLTWPAENPMSGSPSSSELITKGFTVALL
jgi:iron complex outermembrane receptor protein